jgi:hypothetical protein
MDRIDKFQASLFARIGDVFTPAARFPLLALTFLGGPPALPEERCMFSKTRDYDWQHGFN